MLSNNNDIKSEYENNDNKANKLTHNFDIKKDMKEYEKFVKNYDKGFSTIKSNTTKSISATFYRKDDKQIYKIIISFDKGSSTGIEIEEYSKHIDSANNNNNVHYSLSQQSLNNKPPVPARKNTYNSDTSLSSTYLASKAKVAPKLNVSLAKSIPSHRYSDNIFMHSNNDL